ncbi:MAG: prepilin peptidase [Bacillus sp. (in: firmicutes)]
MIIFLTLVLIISIITDLRSRKILNIVTIPSILIGLVYYLFTGGIEGFIYSGKGFLVGAGLLLIPYLLGGMGAGDVKLMAAIGALMGTGFVLYSFIYTALIGGVIALFLILKTRGVKNSIKTVFFQVATFRSNLGEITIQNEKTGSISFPYGVAIVLGTFTTLIWGGF